IVVGQQGGGEGQLAAFEACLGAGAVGRLVGDEALEDAEEEVTEPTAALVGGAYPVVLEQRQEEALGEVLGAGYGVAAGAEETKHRPPVRGDQPTQLGEPGRVAGVLHGADGRPRRGRESVAAVGGIRHAWASSFLVISRRSSETGRVR